MNENETVETDAEMTARLKAIQETPPEKLICQVCGATGFKSLSSFRGHQRMLHDISLNAKEKKISQTLHQDRYREAKGGTVYGSPEFKEKMRQAAIKRWATIKASKVVHLKRGTPEFSERMRQAANKRWEARRLKGNTSSRPYKNKAFANNHAEPTPAPAVPTQQQTIEVNGPNFCPECGHDLRLHKMSARLKKQLEG